jgi:RNA polymerase sigma-70 factor (ECF subfamily)
LKEAQLIKKLKAKNNKALQFFYDEHASKFKYLLFRYVGDNALAEDMLQEGFIRIVEKITQYNGTGSLEAWARRIFVNLALEHLRKKNKLIFSEDNFLESASKENNSENYAFADEIDWDNISDETINMDVVHAADFSDNDLEDALERLPEHYKVVFNLYVVDGYKHKKIAEMLCINEKTSKSRLSKARKITQTFLYQQAINKLKKAVQ